MKLHWGHYITISFIIFAGIVFMMAYISMNTDVNLVAPDYYKQEIRYQQQIDKITNFNSLKIKPTFKLNISSQNIEISFPTDLSADLKNGKILLFRPSQKESDMLYTINLDNTGNQLLSMKGMQNGLWKAKINFQIGDELYYHEKNIIL